MWNTDLDPAQRALAWKALFLDGLTSQSQALQDSYHSLCQAPSSYDAVIQRDLGRTLPQEALFREKAGKGQSALFRVLHALALHLCDIGYVQSLNFIIATLIGVFPDDEALAFHCAQALLFRYSLADFYRPRFPKLGVTAWQFDRLVEGFLPRVHCGLHRHGVTAEYYAMQWFLTLFASDLAQPTVRRIWDRFLLAGWQVIAQVGLALLYEVQDSLLRFDGCEVLTFLKRFARVRQFDTDELLKTASSFEVTHRMLSQLEAAYACEGADQVELSVEKDLNTGRTAWQVNRRPEPEADRGLQDGEAVGEMLLPRPGGDKPAGQKGAQHGTVLPFMIHNLDTGAITVMEAEWSQYMTEKKSSCPACPQHSNSQKALPAGAEKERSGAGSFWSAGRSQQALRELSHA